MQIRAADGDAYIRLGMGGTMGDTNEAECFMMNFYEAVKQYQIDTGPFVSDPLCAKHPITANEIDLSIGIFIDDILRIIVLDASSAQLALGASNFNAAMLDEAVTARQSAQNKTKAETL